MRTHISCIINTIVADDLVTQGARTFTSIHGTASLIPEFSSFSTRRFKAAAYKLLKKNFIAWLPIGWQLHSSYTHLKRGMAGWAAVHHVVGMGVEPGCQNYVRTPADPPQKRSLRFESVHRGQKKAEKTKYLYLDPFSTLKMPNCSKDYKGAFIFHIIYWILFNRRKPDWQWSNPTGCLSYTINVMPADALAT